MIKNTDFSKSEQYTLSIRLGTDGFSFSLFNPLNKENSQQIIEYTVDESISLTANLKRAFTQNDWLSNRFRRVNILMVTKRITYMPLDFFEDEQMETFFYYNHPKSENEILLYNILHQNNIVTIFGMDKSAYHLLSGQYDNIHFFAQVTPLIDYFSSKCRLGNSRKLYAHLRKEQMDLFVFEHGHLLLANTFTCKNSSDRLYHLLYIWKQLGLEQERDELHLNGHLIDKDELLNQLRSYIKQVFIMNPVTNLDFQAIILCE